MFAYHLKVKVKITKLKMLKKEKRKQNKQNINWLNHCIKWHTHPSKHMTGQPALNYML